MNNLFFFPFRLEFQFPDLQKRKKFVKDLFDWLNKSFKKMCMMVLLGPPNAGKTTLMKCLALLAGPYGTIQNSKRVNDFALEQCVNVRSIIVDEAVVDEAFANQLKELCSGTGNYIRQKGQKGVWSQVSHLITSERCYYFKLTLPPF